MTPADALERLMIADVATDQAARLCYAADAVLLVGHAASEECSRQVREASNGLQRLAELLREEASRPVTDRTAARLTNERFADSNQAWGTLPSPFPRGAA